MSEWIKNNFTLVIALYGALLSTIALIWNIYNNSQDKPKIKVLAKFGFFGSSNGAEGPFFFVNAINKGKRSISLSSVGLRSGKEDLINTQTLSLPCELDGGKSHTEWFEIDKLKNRQFNFAWYRDETGKLHRSKSIKNKLNNYFNSKKEK